MVDQSTKEIADYFLVGYMFLFPMVGAGMYVGETIYKFLKDAKKSSLEKGLLGKI